MELKMYAPVKRGPNTIERLEIYTKIREMLKYYFPVGFCSALYLATKEEQYLSSFPELYKRRPHDYVLWFTPFDWTERSKILEDAINEIETELAAAL